MDKRTNPEGQVSNRKSGGGGLGVNGEGALGGAVEGGGKFQEGASGAEKREQSHEQGGMDHVFPELFILTEKTENQENDSKVTRDQGGFMDGTGKEEGGNAQEQVREGEADGDFCHGFVTSRPKLPAK